MPGHESKGLFRTIRPGTKIELHKDFQKLMGFRFGRFVGCVSDPVVVARDGGSYTTERLDGAEDSRDIRHQMHRGTFGICR